MEFSERIAALRKERGLTQQALADMISMHVLQIHRYESGSSQPTLNVIRKLAIALNVSADTLVFDKDEREPKDQLKLRFEAVSHMKEEDQRSIMSLIDAMILKHQAQLFFDQRKEIHS